MFSIRFGHRLAGYVFAVILPHRFEKLCTGHFASDVIHRAQNAVCFYLTQFLREMRCTVFLKLLDSWPETLLSLDYCDY